MGKTEHYTKVYLIPRISLLLPNNREMEKRKIPVGILRDHLLRMSVSV